MSKFVNPMKCFRVRLNSDTGRYSIRTNATSAEEARRFIVSHEKCPERSILSVKQVPFREYPTKAQLTARLSRNAVQVFYVDANEARRARADARKHGARDEEGATLAGWYYWTCLPGCLPDSSPFGPHRSPLAALRDAYDNDFLPDEEDDNAI